MPVDAAGHWVPEVTDRVSKHSTDMYVHPKKLPEVGLAITKVWFNLKFLFAIL